VKQPVSQISWDHLIQLLQRVKGQGEHLWYIQQTIEHGWSRNVLVHQIESGSVNTRTKFTGYLHKIYTINIIRVILAHLPLGGILLDVLANSA